MFIKSTRGYTRDAQQWSKGKFLALFSANKYHEPAQTFTGPDGKEYDVVYGVVRHTHLSQLGHFMMGNMRIGSSKITLSGCYGNDGLTDDLHNVAPADRHYLTRMPDDLAYKFWNGGGWNSAGSEATEVHAWGKSIMGKDK